MRYAIITAVFVVIGFLLDVMGATCFFGISFDDLRLFGNQKKATVSEPSDDDLGSFGNQKNAPVSEPSETNIHIEYQTENKKDPHPSKDSNSVETIPRYTFSDDISVDTGRGISSVFIESIVEDARALEERHPEILRPVEEMNRGLQDLKVKLIEIAADIENKH